MNKRIHRLVFDRKRGMRVPAAEHVRGAGKQAGGQTRAVAVAVASLFTLTQAEVADAAQPLRPVVGTAANAWTNRTNNTPGAVGNLPQRSVARWADNYGKPVDLVYGDTTLIINQEDRRVILNWDSFNIGLGYSVHFQQPVGGSALNKIWDSNPTVIMGKLTSTGEVILENTNGVFFGSTARVEAGRFVATALSLSKETYLKGIRAETDGNTAVFGSNADTAKGFVSLEAGAEVKALAGGDVMMIAPKVINDGSITTKGGQTILAAGQKVYLYSSSDPAQRGLLVSVDGFVPPVAPPDSTEPVSVLPAGTNAIENNGSIRSEKGAINVVGMSIRQNGVLTATTAVKGENGAIYLQAGKTNAAGNGGPKPAELGSIELTEASKTVVELDTSGATQKDAETFYRSNIQVLAKDIRVRSGAVIEAKGGNIDLLATSNNQPGGALSAFDGIEGSLVKDDATLVVENGSRIDASGVKDVQLDMSRNQISGQFFKIELADSPVQRGGVLYRQKVQFDGRNAVTVGNTKGFYNSVERTAQELSTRGGNVRLQSTGYAVLADGAEVDMSGGTLHYQAGTISTSLLRRGDRLITLDRASASTQYDALISASQTLAVDGYVQGSDAGSLSIAGAQRTYAGLSKVKAGVVVGPYQRNGQIADPDGFKKDVSEAATERKSRSQTLYYGQYLPLAAQPNLYASLRPQAGLIAIGLDRGLSESMQQFMAQIDLVKTRQTSVGFVPEPHTLAGDAFFANLPEGTQVSAAEVMQTGASKLTVMADQVSVAADVKLDLGASGVFAAQSTQDLLVAGSIRAAGGKAVLYSSTGDVHLTSTANVDMSGMEVDERGRSASTQALSVKGGDIDIKAGQSALLDAGSVMDVSAGVWRDGKGVVSKGSAGSIAVQVNNALISQTSVPTDDGGTRQVYERHGRIQLQGELAGFDFASGGALTLSGMRTLTIGQDALAADEGLYLSPGFFSAYGFGAFNLSALGDVVVKPGTVLTPTLQNLVFQSASRNAMTDGLVTKKTLEAGQRQGVKLSLKAAGTPAGTGEIPNAGIESGASLSIGAGASVDVGAGGSIALSAGRNLSVDGTLLAHGGSIKLGLTGYRGSDKDASSAADSPDKVGFLSDQWIHLTKHAVLDVSGTAKVYRDASGRQVGEVLGGGTVSLNYDTTTAVRGRLLAEAGSVIDVSGAAGDLTLGRGNALDHISKGAGTINVGSTDGFLLLSELKANRPDDSVSGGAFNANVSRAGLGDVVNGGVAYTAKERAIVLMATAEQAAAYGAEHVGQGVLAADSLNNAGFDRIQLRADDRVVLAEGANLNGPGLRSVVVNTRVLEAQGSGAAGAHQIRAQYVALGDKDLSIQHGESADSRVLPTASAGEATLAVQAGLIEVYGNSALRGLKQTDLNATLGATGADNRTDGEVRWVGRAVTGAAGDVKENGQDLLGHLNFGGTLNVKAGQTYATTLSDFTVQGLLGASSLNVLSPHGGSTSQTPLTALAQLTLGAQNVLIDGVVRQPFGRITINGEETPQLGANSLLSVSGDGVKVPVGTTVNQTQWLYMADGSTLALDPNSFAAIQLDGKLMGKGILVKGKSLVIDGQSQMQAQAGGDLVAWEFIPGTGGSVDTLNRANVFAILPGYTYDFAPYDTEIARATSQAGTQLIAGDQVIISSANGLLQPGKYTLLPARYAILPGAVLVSETTVKSGGKLSQGVVADDGSVTVSGYKTAVGTGINGGQDPRLALVLEPESTFRAKSELQITSINDYLAASDPQQALPGDAGRISLVATEAPFSWAARYNLAGQGATAGGQFELSMADMVVADAGTTSAQAPNAVTTQALKVTGADSILLGGYHENTNDGDRVIQSANTVTVSADVQANEFVAVAKQAVNVDAGVSVTSSGASSGKTNNLVIKGLGAALVASNKVNTSVSRDLKDADLSPDTASLNVGDNVTVTAVAAQFDSSNGMVLGQNLKVQSQALGLGAKHVAVGGKVEDEYAVVADAALLNGKSSVTLRAYEAVDLVGNVDMSQPGLKQIVLDAPTIRGVGQASDVAKVAAERVVLRNTSNKEAAATAGAGQTQLQVKGSPAVADATAEGITIGQGKLNLAFDQVKLETTGDLVFRGQGRASTQGDATIVAARVTADKTADHGIVSAQTLTVTHGAGERTLGDRVGAGGKLALEGKRVVQDGLIDVASGRIDIHGTGLAGQANTIELTQQSETRAAGWVAQAGNDWSTVAPGGQIKVRADEGNVLVDGALDVSAPVATQADGKQVGARAGNIVISATGAATESRESGAVILGRSAQLKGSALTAATSGRVSVDARRLQDTAFPEAAVASHTALDTLAKLIQDGGFHNEIDIRVREGNQALNSSMEATRIKLSADAGSLTLGESAVINAKAERGGVVQLAAGQDLIVSSGAQVIADSSIDPSVGANGGDILLASTNGWVDLQSGAVISAKGDDVADGRVVVRAQAQTGINDADADADAKRIKVKKIGAKLSAADVLVEGVQTYKTADGLNQQSQVTVTTTKGLMTQTAITKVGTKIVTTTSKGMGVQVVTETLRTDPTTGISTTSKTTSDLGFDAGVVPTVTTKSVAATASSPKPSTTVVFDTTSKKTTTSTQTDGLTVGGQDVLANASALMGHQAGMAAALGLDTLGANVNGQVRAGVEIQSDAAFSLNYDWNLQNNTHTAGQPIMLTIRSKGDLNINGSLSAGFASAKSADAAAKTPVGVVAGPAASFRLVAGADLDAANPLATMGHADAGNLTVAAGKMVRTTTGSIELAAAGDVVLAAGSGTAPVQGVVYVAGGPSANPDGASTADRSAWQQFTAHGGRLDVAAGRDVVSPAAAQLINNWFYQTGPKASSVAWASNFDSFKQGYGSFGGGNVSVTAGRNIANPGVVAPTSARTVATGDAKKPYQQVVENGGDIVVRAEGDIQGGVYFLGRGTGLIEAGGSITAGDALGAMPKTGLILGLMDGQWHVQSNGDLKVSAVYNPTMLGFVSTKDDRKKSTVVSAFDTYSSDSALSLASVAGAVDWSVDGGGDKGAFGGAFAQWHKALSSDQDAVKPVVSLDIGARAELLYLPSSLTAQALQGDVHLTVNGPGDVPVVQHGSDQTDLVVYAGQNLDLSSGGQNWVVNNAANVGWTTKTISAPSNSNTVKSTDTANLLAKARIDKANPVDMGVAGNQDPVRIHAEGNINFDGLRLNVAKASLISAGGDIQKLEYVGQHQTSTDVTRIVAGGNLTGHPNNPNTIRDRGVIQISGPGELQLEAGKDLNLQNAYGVESVGLRQADGSTAVGASLRIAAGAGKTVDPQAFSDRYLQDATNQQALIKYVEATLKLTGLSYEQAWAYFQSLTREHQVAFAEPLVSAAFVKRYVDVAQAADPIWAYVARDNKVAIDNTTSDLYKQYSKAQSALVSYVQDLKGVSGLSFEQALTTFRALTGPEQAGLIDKKRTVSASMMAAMVSADTANTYATMWVDRVAQAKAVNSAIGVGYDSVLFAQFRDDVVMKEFKRLGSAVASVADSDNALMNARRQLVRDEIWRQARELTEVAGLAAPYQFKGDLNVASSKIHTLGQGSLTQGGMDLFVPGGSVLVGRAAASAFDRTTEEAPLRGLIAQDGGSIRSYSAGDFQVNSQKAFVVGEGDLLVYSANGNIDSGRGSNTDLAVPPLQAEVDPFTGGIRFVSKAPTTGSGIGILKNADGTSAGKVSLLAPLGEVRALDAFIQGPQIELPGKVIGADNIKGEVKGQAPTPPVSVNLAINTGLGTETAAGETKDQIEAKKTQAKTRSSLVTVDVLGVGEVDATAAGNADDTKKACKDDANCKR